MDPVFGFSIQQPWLDMIIRGVKSMELRSWSQPPKRRGLIALHASWTIDFGAAYLFGYHEPWKLPRGNILAVANIIDTVEPDPHEWYRTVKLHRQPVPAGGVYGIVFEDVRQLSRPIRCRGKLSFFLLDDLTMKKIESFLASENSLFRDSD